MSQTQRRATLRLTLVDENSRCDHYYLDGAQSCYFFGEYTSDKDYTFSSTNSFISNLKKDVSKKGLPEWVHKEHAITKAAGLLNQALTDAAYQNFCVVPVPPSASRSDPNYDDRLVQILNQANHFCGGKLDFREIVYQTVSTSPSHQHPRHRRSPSEISAVYAIEESKCALMKPTIVVFDDMLTTGSHFMAMASVLQDRFPGTSIIGLFLARRVFPEVDDIAF